MLRRRRKAGGAAAELPAGEDGKKADGGYFNSGGMPPSEVEGSMVAVESDSRPVGDGRVHEMTG